MQSVLDQPTLVLNRNWQPVHVTPVQRAATLLYDGRANVVDPETYQIFAWDDWIQVEPGESQPAVRSTSVAILPPEIVVLTSFDRLPRVTVAYSKRNVFKRDRFTCQYCGCQPGKDDLTIDHVVPRSRGGETNWHNCVLACLGCNKMKADKTPAQAGIRLSREPKRPMWQPLYSSLSSARPSWKNFVGELGDCATV